MFHSGRHTQVTNSVALRGRAGMVTASLSQGGSKADKEVGEMIQATHVPPGLPDIKCSPKGERD